MTPTLMPIGGLAMATVNRKEASAASTSVETPWYDLIDDPVPPEDAMQQDDTLYYTMSGIRACAMRTTPPCSSPMRPI